jgi:hypothetical protein
MTDQVRDDGLKPEVTMDDGLKPEVTMDDGPETGGFSA